MVTVFLSYSHKDEKYRDELETHLASLKRQGIIETWHDRRIGAGKEIDSEISENLETADIILLLASSDFIASKYCIDIEVTRALERHEKGEARVIPVIIRPCDWHDLPFGKLNALPIDGRPVSKFPDIDDAFLEITKGIKDAAREINSKSGTKQYHEIAPTKGSASTRIAPNVRSSNLRIKKPLTDHDKDRFQQDAFDYMANFFEESLSELKKRNPIIETNFRRIDANRFTTAIYVEGRKTSSCTIWLGSDRAFLSGILYVTGETTQSNSYNDRLAVESDGYALYLKAVGMSYRSSGKDEKMTFEGAAEYYWSLLLEPLQV